MPIFDVEITLRAAVEAESIADAETWARRHMIEVASDTYEPEVTALGPLAGIHSLPDGWDEDCLPYNGDGHTRLKALLPPNAD